MIDAAAQWREPGRRWSPTRSLLTRVNLLIAVLTVIVAAAAVVSTERIVERSQRRMLQHRAETVATLQAGSLALPVWEFDGKAIEQIGRATMALDTEIRAMRVVASGAGANPAPLLALGAADRSPDSLTIERPIRLLAADGPPREIGRLTLIYDLTEARRTTWTELAPMVGLMLVSLLVSAGLVSLVLWLLVLRPLGRLTRSAGAIAAGRYETRLPHRRGDEIGRLTTAFNQMAEQVQDHARTLEHKVSARTRELEQSHRTLEATTNKVMESIDTARLIQTAMLPPPGALRPAGIDAFALWLPRDVVGGDFYVMRVLDQGVLIGVIDCTGHGVPGALMAMTASTVLDQVIDGLGIVEPAAILAEMNRRMRRLLNPGERRAGQDAGLDMAICLGRPDAGRLAFAGARIGLIGLGSGAIETWRGDSHSIGYRRSDPGFGFVQHEIAWRPGQRFYLTTDGLLDQAGGPRGFGFGRSRLAELLIELSRTSLDAQAEAIRHRLAAYQGALPQRDDITILGFASHSTSAGDPA